MPGAVSNGESPLSLKAGLLRSRALQAHAETPRGRLLLARPAGGSCSLGPWVPVAPPCVVSRVTPVPGTLGRQPPLRGKPVSPWVPVETQPFEPLARLVRAESPGTEDTGPKSKGVTCRTSFSLSSGRCKVAR